ncbi:hypothetical protein JOM56_014509 [Amanita muscaria]
MRRFQIWKVHRAGRLPVSRWTRALYSCKGRLHNRLLVMLEKDTLGDQLDRAGQSTVSIIDLATQLLAGSARPAPYQGGQANGVSDCTGAVLKLGTSFNSQIANAGCRKEEDHIGTICCEDLSCTGTAVRKLRTCRVRQRKHSGESWTARGQFGLERAAVSGQSRQHEEMAPFREPLIRMHAKGSRRFAHDKRVVSFKLRAGRGGTNRLGAVFVQGSESREGDSGYLSRPFSSKKKKGICWIVGKQSGYQASTLSDLRLLDGSLSDVLREYLHMSRRLFCSGGTRRQKIRRPQGLMKQLSKELWEYPQLRVGYLKMLWKHHRLHRQSFKTVRGYHGGIIDCLEQSNRILQKCGRDHVRMVQGVCDGEHVEKGDRLREGSLKSSTSVFCSRTLQQPFSMPVSSNYLNSWAHIDIMASLPFFGEGDTPPWEGYQLNGNSLMFRTSHRTSWTIRDGPKILLSRQRMRTLSGKTRGVLISITKDRWERIGCTEVLAIDGNSEASGDLEVEFQQRSAVGHRVPRSTAAGITPSNTERAHETSDGVRWVSGDAISIMDCAGSLIGRDTDECGDGAALLMRGG